MFKTRLAAPRLIQWAILLTLVASLINFKPVHAGAPSPPELVSPSNNSLGDGNPPQLCARNMGDPEGDPVQIRFEIWGGGEANHISPWIAAGSPGEVVCWRDTAPWTAETHSWQARAVDNHDQQSGASPDWSVQVPASPTPSPTCTIDHLTVTPPDPQPVGTLLSIYASATCSNGVSSLRFRVDGNLIGSVSGSAGTVKWNSAGAAATAHTVTVEAFDGIGVIRKTRSTNYDLTSGAPPPTEDVNCSINSFSLSPPSPQPPGAGVELSGSASCNTGVRAIRILINGGSQYEIGAPSVSWTWNTSGWSGGDYAVTLEAAGWGDNTWSQSAKQTKTYRLEASAPTSAPVANSFSTGDVIQIGYDVYVIVSGQRRLVPNPSTLDALGIPRSWIDNQGFSDAQLRTIPRGADIPDVNREPGKFEIFKSLYFPDTAPIVPANPVPTQGADPQPTVALEDASPPASAQASFTDTPPTLVDRLNTWVESVLDRLSGEVEAYSEWKPRSAFSDSTECVGFIGNKKCRGALYWLGYNAYPYNWVEMASSAAARELGVSVHSTPEIGDIVVWDAGCGKADDDFGHVAYVSSTNPDGTFNVIESNWNHDHKEGRRANLAVLSCMSFIRDGCDLTPPGISPPEPTLTYPWWVPKFARQFYDDNLRNWGQ